jgi:epsilon-lactone hydrolase
VVRRTVQLVSRRIFDPTLPWPVQRQRAVQFTRLPVPPRGTVVERRRIGGVDCEVVTAGPVVPGRSLLHLHGGGFCIGEPRMYRSMAARLAGATMAEVIVADYRLAPEHPWPAGLDDALAVWEALDHSGRVGLSGDSAGGNLALCVALHARDCGGPTPVGLVLVAPAVDVRGTAFGDDPRPETDEIMLTRPWTEAAVAAYAGEADLQDPRLSPITADLAGLPAMVIVAAVEEMLAGDADRLSAKARAAGVDVIDVRGRGMWHDYPMQAGLVAEADHAVMRIATFLTTRFGG